VKTNQTKRRMMKMKNVRMGLNYLGTTTGDNNWKCNEYKATLKYGSKQLTVPFYTGMGWDKEPSVDDVLSSLVMDAKTSEYTTSFEDFAHEFGYDADSRKAEKTYKDVMRTGKKVINFLGDDYESFQKKYEDY
jgi:hypothetical protein